MAILLEPTPQDRMTARQVFWPKADEYMTWDEDQLLEKASEVHEEKGPAVGRAFEDILRAEGLIRV